MVPPLGFSPASPAEKSSMGSPALEVSPPKFSPPVKPPTGSLGFSTPVVCASRPESESQPHLLWPFPDEKAEEFACRLAAKSSPIVTDEIVELFKLLPKEKPPRGGGT